jgi:hypothetical protein
VPSPDTVAVLTSPEVLRGLTAGFAALAVGLVIVVVWRQKRDAPVPIIGLLLAAAAGGVLIAGHDLPNGFGFGLALLAFGGALCQLVRLEPALTAALAVPGAWLIAGAIEPLGSAWVSWLLFGFVVLGGALVSNLDLHYAESGYGPILFLISLAGMFATLPDTEEILVVLGAALPLVLLAWPKAFAFLGAFGIFPTMGLLAWVIAVGARGRESAVIGAVACLGLLVVEPVVRRQRGASVLDRLPAGWSETLVVVCAQVIVVLVAARVVGLRETAAAALVIAIALIAATGFALGRLGKQRSA